MVPNLSLPRFPLSKIVKFPFSPVETLYLFQAVNWWKAESFSCLNTLCFAQETHDLAKHLKPLLLTEIISEEVWAEICLRGKNQVKQETDFQEGTLSNESLKSHQEKHAVNDRLELVGDEVILQRILNSRHLVFRVEVRYVNWWDDLSSKKSPEMK